MSKRIGGITQLFRGAFLHGDRKTEYNILGLPWEIYALSLDSDSSTKGGNQKLRVLLMSKWLSGTNAFFSWYKAIISEILKIDIFQISISIRLESLCKNHPTNGNFMLDSLVCEKIWSRSTHPAFYKNSINAWPWCGPKQDLRRVYGCLWFLCLFLHLLLIYLTIPSLSTRLHQALTESTHEKSEPLRRVLPYWHRRRHATPLGTCGKATHWIQPPGGQLEEICWKVCMRVLWWTHFGERGTPMLRDLYKFEYRE